MGSSEPDNLSGRETQTARRWLQYKEGGRDAWGDKIVNIVHQTQRGAIYLTESGSLIWDVEENLGAHWVVTTREAFSLITQVKTTINSNFIQNRALKMIASGLAVALEATTTTPQDDFLVKAREFITVRQREVFQIRYFIAAVVTTMITTPSMALISARATPLAREFLIAALLGGAGALISVSQRFRSIAIEPFSSSMFTAIGGGSRVFFGCAFGAIFLLFQKAGIVLSLANGQPFLLAAAAFVAGFSERAIPEVLEKFEQQITARKNSEKRMRAV